MRISDITKDLGCCATRVFFVALAVHGHRKGNAVVDVEKQAAEINRVLEAVGKVINEIKPVHPREASLALLSIAIQMHRQGSTMTDAAIRNQLDDMVMWLLSNTLVVNKKEIN